MTGLYVSFPPLICRIQILEKFYHVPLIQFLKLDIHKEKDTFSEKLRNIQDVN